MSRLAHLHKKKAQHVQHQQHVQEQPVYSQNPGNIQTHVQSGSKHGAGKVQGRPVFPSTNSAVWFDKQAHRKGELSYPPPDSLYTCKDTDIDPKFLRTSSTVLSGPVLKSSMPVALWVTPFANDEVCVVELTAPLRCPRCKGYVNPYFQFDGTRRSATCNLCGLRFQIDEAIDKMNSTSTEVATQSILDFRVSDKFYIKKRTDLIKIIVLVEFSMPMMEHGIIGTIIDSIKSVVESHEFESKVRIGVAFYSDQGVGFIRAAEEEGGQPIVFMVPQGKGSMGCCPLSDDEFLMDPATEKQKITGVLDYLQNYCEFAWKQGRFTHTANYVFALRCMRDGFVQETGKIMLFSLLDPRAPPCGIRARTEEQNKTPLKPIHLEAYEYAKELMRARVGVEHFYFSKDALVSHELATTHFLSSTTGGKLHLYTHYNPDTHGLHLYYSIFHALTKICKYDVDFTCRASNGLTVCRYGAPDGPRESRDVSLATVDSSNSFIIELQHEEKLQEHVGAYVQFAAMYTTGNGERRIRTINFKFQVRAQPAPLYQSVDYLTLSNVILRNYTAKLLKGLDPQKIRQDAINFIGAVVGEARGRCPNANTQVGGLTVPHGMGWMFAYLGSVINSRLFLNWMKLPSDHRIYTYLQVQQLNPYLFASRFYPRVYPLTMDIYEVEEGSPVPGDFIEDQEGEEEEQENKIAILPQNIILTKQFFKQNGIYLADNGDQLVIYVQGQADEQTKMELFGTTDLSEIQAGGLPELETSHNIRVNNIVNEIRRRSALNGAMYQPLSVKTPIKKGPYAQAVASLLKQDLFECDFSTFLNSIQRAVVLPK